MWGISVQQVLDWIANGTVASYADGQFLFVDITSRGHDRAKAAAASAPAAEEDVVTPQELSALTQDTSEQSTGNEHHVDEDSIPEEEADAPQRDVAQWRTARQNASRQRRPPAATKS
jgi:hypothetical protein